MADLAVDGLRRRLASYLEPPHFEDLERQRRATVLHYALLISAAVIAILVPATAGVYRDPVSALVARATFATLLLGCLFGLWLLRRGRLDAAALGVPGAIWLSLTVAACWLDGIHGAGVFMYPALVLLAGFLVGVRAAAAFALLCSLSALGLGLAGDHGLLPAAPTVPTLRLWSTLSTSLVMATGVAWLILGSLQSALREAETSRREFEDLFNEVPDGIVSVGSAGQIESINRAAERLLGVRAADAGGRRLVDVLPRSSGPVGELDVAIAGEGDAPALVELSPTPGEPIWVEINSRSHTHAPGTRHVELTLRDVTERVRTESERRSLETQLGESRHLEAVGRLAGGIAHDFNNLLTVIQGNSELLIKEEECEEHRDQIAEVRDAAQQAASLTRQLLAFAKRQVLEPEWIDLNEVIRSLEPILDRLTGEGIQLLVELDGDLGAIRADRTQLQQVLINLATNARDAMPYGGRVRIDTARAQDDALASQFDREPGNDGWVRLRVHDEGVGMDEETLASAFEPFFTRKQTGRGTGLGLASVYGIVQQSEGHVHIESQVGQGSVVSVYLPEYGERPTTSVPRHPVPEELAGTETVLLVEDETPVRLVLARVLERAGYRVVTASSGEEALAACEAEIAPIDLLLTDVVMPGLSGPRLANRLARRLPDLKIVLLSGHADEEAIAAEVDHGRALFIAKPPSRRTLLTTVRQALGSGSADPGIRAS